MDFGLLSASATFAYSSLERRFIQTHTEIQLTHARLLEKPGGNARLSFSLPVLEGNDSYLLCLLAEGFNGSS